MKLDGGIFRVELPGSNGPRAFEMLILTGSYCDRFRAAVSSRLILRDNNVTQRNSGSPQTNLLKEFQECITDQEAYPTVELTCSEYGKVFESSPLASSETVTAMPLIAQLVDDEGGCTGTRG